MYSTPAPKTAPPYPAKCGLVHLAKTSAAFCLRPRKTSHTSPQQRRHSLLAQCMRPTLNVRPKVWRHRTTSLTPNHPVYIEPRVAIVSQRSGHHLNRHIPLNDSQLEDCLALFSHLVHRPFKPLKRIIIESINNEPATESRHPKTFKTVFNAHNESAEFVLYRS